MLAIVVSSLRITSVYSCSFVLASAISACLLSWSRIHCCSSYKAVSISAANSFPSSLFRAPRKFEASVLANLNFRSNNSRSKNLAKISFLFVEPSRIKDRESNCDDIEVNRKSSIVPKVFLISLSVSFLVRLLWVDSVPSIAVDVKTTSVLASVICCPLDFLVYLSDCRWMFHTVPSSVISSKSPLAYSLSQLMTFRFLRSFLDVVLNIVYSKLSIILDLPEKFLPKIPTMPLRLAKSITLSSP